MNERALMRVSPTFFGYPALRNYNPRCWTPWGRFVSIEPVPDDVYVLKLFVADYPDTALINPTDVPSCLPEEFRPCIVDFACFVLSLKLRKWKQAAMYYNIYIRNLKKRRKEYIERKAEKRAIHRIPDNVKGREQPEKRNLHRIPNNVRYKGGQPWAH